MQGEHQLASQAFLQGMLTNERLQFGDQLSGHPPLEVGIDPSLDRLEAQLLEAGDLGLGE